MQLNLHLLVAFVTLSALLSAAAPMPRASAEDGGQPSPGDVPVWKREPFGGFMRKIGGSFHSSSRPQPPEYPTPPPHREVTGVPARSDVAVGHEPQHITPVGTVVRRPTPDTVDGTPAEVPWGHTPGPSIVPPPSGRPMSNVQIHPDGQWTTGQYRPPSNRREVHDADADADADEPHDEKRELLPFLKKVGGSGASRGAMPAHFNPPPTRGPATGVPPPHVGGVRASYYPNQLRPVEVNTGQRAGGTGAGAGAAEASHTPGAPGGAAPSVQGNRMPTTVPGSTMPNTAPSVFYAGARGTVAPAARRNVEDRDDNDDDDFDFALGKRELLPFVKDLTRASHLHPPPRPSQVNVQLIHGVPPHVPAIKTTYDPQRHMPVNKVPQTPPHPPRPVVVGGGPTIAPHGQGPHGQGIGGVPMPGGPGMRRRSDGEPSFEKREPLRSCLRGICGGSGWSSSSSSAYAHSPRYAPSPPPARGVPLRHEDDEGYHIQEGFDLMEVTHVGGSPGSRSRHSSPGTVDGTPVVVPTGHSAGWPVTPETERSWTNIRVQPNGEWTGDRVPHHSQAHSQSHPQSHPQTPPQTPAQTPLHSPPHSPPQTRDLGDVVTFEKREPLRSCFKGICGAGDSTHGVSSSSSSSRHSAPPPSPAVSSPRSSAPSSPEPARGIPVRSGGVPLGVEPLEVIPIGVRTRHAGAPDTVEGRPTEVPWGYTSGHRVMSPESGRPLSNVQLHEGGRWSTMSDQRALHSRDDKWDESDGWEGDGSLNGIKELADDLA